MFVVDLYMVVQNDLKRPAGNALVCANVRVLYNKSVSSSIGCQARVVVVQINAFAHCH